MSEKNGSETPFCWLCSSLELKTTLLPWMKKAFHAIRKFKLSGILNQNFWLKGKLYWIMCHKWAGYVF